MCCHRLSGTCAHVDPESAALLVVSDRMPRVGCLAEPGK